jgi:Uma2 family endonuclease
MAMRAGAEKLYSVEEFEKLPEFDNGYELLEGRLVKLPLTQVNHGRIIRRLIVAYYNFDPKEQIGEMLTGEVNVRLSDNHAPAPDIAFWKKENKPANSLGAAPRPDMVAEVWSSSDWEHPTQARSKAKRYIETGVLLVWLINPKQRNAEVYRPGQPVVTIGEQGTLDGGEVIPGFSVFLAPLFE